MDHMAIFSRYCRDMVTGVEGYVLGCIDWVTGSRQLIIQPVSDSKIFMPDCVRVLESRVQIYSQLARPDIKSKKTASDFKSATLMGHMCRDRYTGCEGVVVGIVRAIFSDDQYILERHVNSEKWDHDMWPQDIMYADNRRLIDLGIPDDLKGLHEKTTESKELKIGCKPSNAPNEIIQTVKMSWGYLL